MTMMSMLIRRTKLQEQGKVGIKIPEWRRTEDEVSRAKRPRKMRMSKKAMTKSKMIGRMRTMRKRNSKSIRINSVPVTVCTNAVNTLYNFCSMS